MLDSPKPEFLNRIAAPNGEVGAGPSGRIAPSEFDDFLARTTEGQKAPYSLRVWRDLAEAWRITRALETCQGNRSAAARELGIGRRTLYAKMEKLGIEARWNA